MGDLRTPRLNMRDKWEISGIIGDEKSPKLPLDLTVIIIIIIIIIIITIIIIINSFMCQTVLASSGLD